MSNLVDIGCSLLTVIPARGGSKRLPRKNVRIFGDLPLIGWSHESWKRAGLPGVCWLSTDDEQIAAIGRELGIETPFVRPRSLAEDGSSSVDVMLHAVDHYHSIKGREPEWVSILQPTSPLRPPSVLRTAWDRVASAEGLDGIVGVRNLHRTLRSIYTIDSDGQVQSLPPMAESSSSGELFTPNGAIYYIRTRALKLERRSVPRRSMALVMDASASVDIDDEDDWKIAELLVHAGEDWRGQGLGAVDA